MNASIMAILILVSILIIGFFKLILSLRTVNKNGNLLVEFTKKFIELANAYYSDEDFQNENYEYLLANVDEVNNLLGGAGVIAYKPAYANFMHNNYQILINTLPQFKSQMGPHQDDVTSLESILKRVAGVIKKEATAQISDLKNPLKWFSAGISSILSLPLTFLKSIGLLSNRSYNKVKTSGVFKFLIGIISLISFIDTIYTIFTGTSFSIQLIKLIITKL